MKIAKFLIFALLPSCVCIATQPETSGIPASINHIETHRAGDQILRVIKHNMELNPVLELELFDTPDMKIADYKKLENVIWNGKTIVFKNSDAIYIDSISMEQNQLSVAFDYFPPKGDESHFICKLQIKPSSISTPVCN